MPVDSFKYLPRLIATLYRMMEREPKLPIPWTPLERPIAESTVGLVTSAGFYLPQRQQPFDLDRERRTPTWGDPTYRAIPASVDLQDLAVSHLHLSTADLERDPNIALPMQRFQELAARGEVGRLAEEHYSFMGYQGYPPDTSAWRERYGPEIAQRLLDNGANAVLLTPA